MSKLTRSESETQRIKMDHKKHKLLSERANRLGEQGFPLDPYVWGPLVWLGSPFLFIGLFLLLWYVARSLTQHNPCFLAIPDSLFDFYHV